jgi:hypothetical protein
VGRRCSISGERFAQKYSARWHYLPFALSPSATSRWTASERSAQITDSEGKEVAIVSADGGSANGEEKVDRRSEEGGAGRPRRRDLIVQIIMLTKLGSDRIGHDLAPVDLSRLAPVNCGVAARLRIAMDGHLEIAGADPLLHDFFELGRCFLLLTHDRCLL